MPANGAVGGNFKVAVAGPQMQPEAPRLRIGFLECPILEKSSRPVLPEAAAQVLLFPVSEINDAMPR